jgi:hypothetical protein
MNVQVYVVVRLSCTWGPLKDNVLFPVSNNIVCIKFSEHNAFLE